MSRRAVSASAAIGLFAVLLAAPAFAQAPVSVGGEFQINTATVSNQLVRTRRSVARESNGDFVVVWSGFPSLDGSVYGVFGQRFSSSGTKIAIEFQVNTYTTGAQDRAAVASDGDGDFVVVWHSEQDGAVRGVFGRRFNSSGAALAAEFQINLATNALQHYPTVGSDASGNFVVAWTDTRNGNSDVFGRRFNAAGVGLGGEFVVTAFTVDEQASPALDIDQNGNFVIVWTSGLQDGNGTGVFGQLFNPAGLKLGPELPINTFVAFNQNNATVGQADNGDFVVAWQSYGQDGLDYGVFARRFDSSGTPRDNQEFMVGNFATGDQLYPSIHVDASGDFVIAWESDAQEPGNGSGVFARHFHASGVPTSNELPVNTYVTGNQLRAAVGGTPNGDFLVVWSSAAQDGDGLGVFGQRFNKLAVLDIDGNGELTALTDGLLILRHFFGFTGTTLTGGAVAVDCTRCDSAAILPYLQSLS